MEYFKFLANGDLENIPSPTSSKSDFDFFEGNWKIRNRKLKTRLNNCQDWIEFEGKQEMKIVLQGLANIDHFFITMDDQPFEGMSMRFFDQKTKLWYIYWSDISKTGILEVPVIGSFYGNIGHFYTKEKFNNKDIIAKVEWDKTDSDHIIWKQGFSEDNGESWEWNWWMYLERG